MRQPLTNILLKIFANGFYRAHAGLFLFLGLVMVGAIPPEQLWMYEKTLMITFISSPVMMAVVFAAWLIYIIKSVHYVSGQIFAVNQQFLFYSSNSFSRREQIKSWFWVQFVIMLPIAAYGLIAVFAGFAAHYYLGAAAILVYTLLLVGCCAVLYTKLVNRLMDGSNQSVLLRLGSKLRKPFFSLFIYHIFDKMKMTFIVAKALSWLIITGVFYLFADVKHDVRVGGIAMLAIITAHSAIIYRQHVFENQYLTFSRNFPLSYGTRFLNYVKVYFILLVPEAIWLFSRFNPLIALELLLFALSTAMVFHCLIYRIGVDMDRYLQWILGLFVVIFWVILFRLLPELIILNLGVAFMIFWRNYYGERVVVSSE